MTLVDADARSLIIDRGLDQTLFVEAGAGTGKTTQLVERIVNLVLSGRAQLSEIAAITFTDAAASELRDRIRERFERELGAASEPGGSAQHRKLVEAALSDTDIAAISTLHAFAQRVLSEHPVDIGIPPRIDVLDEVQSQLAFEDRWSSFLDRLLQRADIEEVIVRALLLRVRFNSRHSGLRQIALKFNDNWDRLDAMAAEPADLAPFSVDRFLTEVAALRRLRDTATNPDDKLIPKVEAALAYGDLVASTDSPSEHLRLLDRFRFPDRKAQVRPKSTGNKANWSDIEVVRDAVGAVRAEADEILLPAKNSVLRALAIEVAAFTQDAAATRRSEGRLEFHDLLVLARQLLRESGSARETLGQRYRFLLLDEFQDTDPIQIELAALIASATSDAVAHRWQDISTDPGRLFFVGDPKQSIYRFRRAEIELFDRAKARFGAGESSVALTQNFRTVAPVLDFINDFFSLLMDKEIPEQQPAYRPLSAARVGADDIDHRPTILGGPHLTSSGRTLTAGDIRTREAADIAKAIAHIRAEPHKWRVQRPSGEWCCPQLRDITILIPTRTALRHLQTALDRHGIAHRADTGTLVYDTQEVRDLLATLRAIDDPGNPTAVVAALRSPLFGVGDDDLLSWRRAGGSWDFRLMLPDDVDHDNHAVAIAFRYLNQRHQDRWTAPPSELIESVIRERNGFQLGCADDRPRDTWGRLRFLQDQARLFAESDGGDLRDFLHWTTLQSADGARVHEPRLDEPDDDSVRIMTVHGAKGLEFPIVFVAGLTTLQQARPSGVAILFAEDSDLPEIKLNADTKTLAFDRQADLEAEMDKYEKERLLYVALTRARDHLFVSAHHAAETKPHRSHSSRVASYTVAPDPEAVHPCIDPVRWRRGLASDAVVEGEAGIDSADGAAQGESSPVDIAAWAERRDRLLAAQRRPPTLSATRIAQIGSAIGENEFDADIDIESGIDHAAKPWRRGRAGTAIGRAVHSVLQSVDLTADPMHPDLTATVNRLATAQAQAEAVPWAAGEIAATTHSVLSSEFGDRVRTAKRHFKEMYVAAPVGLTVIEGYVDLVIDTGPDLIIVDYKTDQVPTDAELQAKLDHYRLQGATYALAVEQTSSRPVSEVVFVFCGPERVIVRSVDDLVAAKQQVQHIASRPVEGLR